MITIVRVGVERLTDGPVDDVGAVEVAGFVMSTSDAIALRNTASATLWSSIVITRDQKRVDLPTTIDAVATASVVATYGQGSIRVGLVAYDRSRFEHDTELLLTSLGF